MALSWPAACESERGRTSLPRIYTNPQSCLDANGVRKVLYAVPRSVSPSCLFSGSNSWALASAAANPRRQLRFDAHFELDKASWKTSTDLIALSIEATLYSLLTFCLDSSSSRMYSCILAAAGPAAARWQGSSDVRHCMLYREWVISKPAVIAFYNVTRVYT